MNEGGLPNLDTEAVIYSDVSTLSHRQQVVGDSSPVYGFCYPNRRFGQNLTLGKGAFQVRAAPAVNS